MRLGESQTFHNVQFRWTGQRLTITRGEDHVIDIENVESVVTEQRAAPETHQFLLYLRVHAADKCFVFFIDADEVQTNVRLVSSDLGTLDEVLGWLLPPGFVHRQGDVGIYERQPSSDAREIPSAQYPVVFEGVLSGRHSLEDPESCRFFSDGDRYFVEVRRDTCLVHPEHPAITLEPGWYQLVGARGECLPSFIGLRDGESAAYESNTEQGGS